MRDDLPNFEEHHGPVDSPRRHVDWSIHQGRQLGKTTKMIDALPTDKRVAIMVWRMEHGRHIEQSIREKRPEIDMRNILFVTRQDYIQRLAGFRGPVFIDNAVLDMVQTEFVAGVNSIYERN